MGTLNPKNWHGHDGKAEERIERIERLKRDLEVRELATCHPNTNQGLQHSNIASIHHESNTAATSELRNSGFAVRQLPFAQAPTFLQHTFLKHTLTSDRLKAHMSDILADQRSQ